MRGIFNTYIKFTKDYGPIEERAEYVSISDYTNTPQDSYQGEVDMLLYRKDNDGNYIIIIDK